MTFSDLTTKLLSKDNCAILLGGALFVQDLHRFVRYWSRSYHSSTDNDEKQMLYDLVSTIDKGYDNARRLPVGSNKPKK